MVLTSLIAALMICAVATHACGEVFPICGWVMPEPTASAYATYKAANFTMVLNYWKPGADEADFQLARAAGLGYLYRPLSSCTSEECLAQQAAWHSDDPVKAGYFVYDEPSPWDFYGYIGTQVQYFAAHDPKRLSMCNLLPDYASSSQLGGRTYPQYVAEYLGAVQPNTLSYDHYPILSGGGDIASFYSNMEVIRADALNRGIPFHGFAYVCSAGGVWRTASESDIYWQIYSLIAYGAHGIWYFTYEDSSPWSGLLDSSGNPTDRYYVVQAVNGEVLAISSKLLNLTSTAVYHKNSGSAPAGTTAFPSGGAYFIKSITGDDFLVGFFSESADTASPRYFMIMNKMHGMNLTSAATQQSCTLTFDPSVSFVTRYNPQDGTPQRVDLSGNELVVTLGGGHAELYEITTEPTPTPTITPTPPTPTPTVTPIPPVGNIDPTEKWAWNENGGWNSLRPNYGGATVTDAGVYGHVWQENVGWIRLAVDDDPPYRNTDETDWGVNNDGHGNLSGYGWSDIAGWVNFYPTDNRVVIDPVTGDFSGYAWAENVGWIHFASTGPVSYKVRTTWAMDNTPTPTSTPTIIPTHTPPPTNTPTAPSPTSTPTRTPTPTLTPTVTMTWTPTVTPTSEMTPTPTPSGTESSTPTPTAPAPTATPTPSGTPSCLPVITNIEWDDESTPKGDVIITWDSQPGVEYDVYYADALTGTYMDVADVTASGSSASWTDDGTQTGSHPSTVGERYYKIGCRGSSVYAEYIVGMNRLVMRHETGRKAYSAVSLPLIPYYDGDAPDINDVIGNQGHASGLRAFADKIWRFDPVAQSFVSYCWNHNGVWEGYPAGTPTTIDPDTCFAFLYQNSETDRDQEIYVVGKAAKGNECRNAVTGKGVTVSKYSYVGYPYLGAESLENAHLIEDGFTGSVMRALSDKVWLFDFETQSFKGYAWYDTASWQYSGTPAFELEPGDAYLIQNKNEANDWVWTAPNPVSY